MSASPFSRPDFDATGRVVCRRALRMGTRPYEPGQELSAADRQQLTDRQLATWWQMGLVDTPRRTEAPQGAKSANARR